VNELTQKAIEACIAFCDAMADAGENVDPDVQVLLGFGHHRDYILRDSMKGSTAKVLDHAQKLRDALSVPAVPTPA